jgi:hypothetical protein
MLLGGWLRSWKPDDDDDLDDLDVSLETTLLYSGALYISMSSGRC